MRLTEIAAIATGRSDARTSFRGSLLFLLGTVFVVSSVAVSAPFLAGPPPGFTGGFGEANCGQCHYGSAVGNAAGSLTVAGLPRRYAAGQTYVFTVMVKHPVLERGGFQIAARFAEGAGAGRNAGELSGDSARTQTVTALSDPTVRYLSHTEAGTTPTAPHVARWRLKWTAPASASLPVVLYIAANAANGDDSPFGDFVYVDSVRVLAAPRGAR